MSKSEDRLNTDISFQQAVSELRPELYRYCTRMTGSLIDAEDVLQEALTQAYAAWPDTRVTQLRGWLFRIAHNRAIDFLRQSARHKNRHSELTDVAPLSHVDPGNRLEEQEVATMALSAFLYLTPLQRSCIILKEVNGFSLEDIATSLNTSPGAIKSALFRGRKQLQKLAQSLKTHPAPLPLAEPETRLLETYIAHFNARNFEALRQQLLQEVRLELVDFTQLEGAQDVGQYFTRYASFDNWTLKLIQIEQSPAIQVTLSAPEPRSYLVLIEWQDGKIARIRDYRHAVEKS